MDPLTYRTTAVNGVELQVSVSNEGGERGLALLLHGFPELAFSWRHQIPALADAGYEVVATPDTPADEDCIDYLFFVHDRHDGNMDAARRYLEWETGLIAQLDEQERSVLNPRAHFDLDGTS